mmetsp:Transcript_4404/g.9507  ORF Transcript_4404/g.9507 Transcript_4404/m.9507 type:complete len:351 (+) Transcript_4404:4310-5362(+)
MGQGDVGLLQLGVGSRQLLALRLHLRHHVKVLDNVDGPLAQTGSGARLVVDGIPVEVGQLQVGARGIHHLLGQLALVNDGLEGLEPLQELVHVVHHLLSRRPGLVLGVVLQQDQHHSRDVIHTLGRLLEGLGLTQILLVQRVQGGLSLGHQGLCSSQVTLAAGLLLRHLLGNDCALLRLNLSSSVLLSHLLLLHAHLLSEDVGAGHLLLHLHSHGLGVLHQHIHLALHLGQLVQTILQAVTVILGGLAFAGEHILVELDELQEGLGGGVVVPPLRVKELLADAVDQLEAVGHELHHSGTQEVLAQLNLIQELLGHREQGALGPGLEPVNHGGCDGSQEALGADAEVLAHR